MRIHCFGCGKPVSSEVPDDTVLRATAECPECIEANPLYDIPNPAAVGEVIEAARKMKGAHDIFVAVGPTWSTRTGMIEAKEGLSKALAALDKDPDNA